MPYKIIKNTDGRYHVINTKNKKIKAYDTTLRKAKKQVRLLNYIEHR